MEQRHTEVTRIDKCGELLEGGGLFRCEHTRFGRLNVSHRGALERIALGGLGPQQHEPASGEPTDHIGGDPPIAKLRERQSRGAARQDVQRLSLLRGEPLGLASTHRVRPQRRQRRHAHRLERRRLSFGSRRHCSADRIADSSQVVVSHPSTQCDHVRRQQRFLVEHLDHIFQLAWCVGGVLDDAAGEDARADGHSHTRADRRNRHAVRNAISEEIKERNWDCDGY